MNDILSKIATDFFLMSPFDGFLYYTKFEIFLVFQWFWFGFFEIWIFWSYKKKIEDLTLGFGKLKQW